MGPTAQRRIVRFGVYEADFDNRQLTKSGFRIRLQDKPFQLLVLLLERQGVVVTREELKEKLWPGDTFVEFDVGLNTAVKKLRAALNDSADNPVS
jgi:DNA-binding winged helix-turn-helix (wHTH) protein